MEYHVQAVVWRLLIPTPGGSSLTRAGARLGATLRLCCLGRRAHEISRSRDSPASSRRWAGCVIAAWPGTGPGSGGCDRLQSRINAGLCVVEDAAAAFTAVAAVLPGSRGMAQARATGCTNAAATRRQAYSHFQLGCSGLPRWFQTLREPSRCHIFSPLPFPHPCHVYGRA